ncbi:hypothetical protein PPO43_01465 [Saprospira sp. CCB-QB6]|uniref:hypothetical protein n=1 Tax=Saprospira sp. CCB-QB6 TaxID=3023936 RepID=UPI0023492FB4|nr:hypothetical protein [Saprospira sp. CCB-QB6]WCL81764.1 hypothetical protein PPO43_01465 [Saprospira sp. CCB-QB6]
MNIFIRNNKKFTATLLTTLFSLTVCPFQLFALTSGPSQQEYAAFEQATTTEMVDLYSGDFTYNIPLLAVPGPQGGYPINLAYHSGIGMDQEASWVGLGWTVNVGAVNRSLRGLPDDFNGDKVEKKSHYKKSTTIGLNLDLNRYKEVFGVRRRSGRYSIPTGQIYWNNNKGIGFRVESSIGGGIFSADLSYDTQSGIGLSPTLSLSKEYKNATLSVGVGANMNSREGIRSLNFVAGGEGSSKSKNGRKSAGGNANLGLTFSKNQSVPMVTMPTKTTHLKLKGIFGTASGWGTFLSSFPLNWSGVVVNSRQSKESSYFLDAYGYLNLNSSKLQDASAITDFNAASTSYNLSQPNLPTSTLTHDVFLMTAQGIGSAFRAHRSDIGILSQHKNEHTIKNYSFGAELAVFPYHIGLDVGLPVLLGKGTIKSGGWSDDFSLLDHLAFTEEQNSRPDYEPSYFKELGDRPALLSSNHYNDWGGDEAVRVNISNSLSGIEATGLSSGATATAERSGFDGTTERAARTVPVQKLTADEAKIYGFSKNLTYKDATGSNTVERRKFPTGTQPIGHHISEIISVQPDGMRYIYGLAAYNLSQEDLVFSVEKDDAALTDYKIDVPTGEYYKSGSLASPDQEFLDKTKLPAYVNSWMLTDVVSADYIDVTGDGVTDDDHGYWVKFKYKKTSDEYHWRVPYSQANYMPGTSNPYDDKGSYSKGVKELYYLDEVHTKTHVAVFETEERTDGFGADPNNINGGKEANVSDGNKMYKLKKIKLYTKKEYEKYKQNSARGIPTKVVNFEYNDETAGLPNLSGNTPNAATASTGKLTLRKLYFTYGLSSKGSATPYVFDYIKSSAGNTANYNSDLNPNYSDQAYDCWGNYRDITKYQGANGEVYPYMEFPYVNQDDPEDPAIWHLTSISLPTGSKLNIDYERDDYAYVEDKKALQMYDILGLGNDLSEIPKNQANEYYQRGVYDDNSGVYEQQNALSSAAGDKIFFPLKEPMSMTTTLADLNADFYKKYLEEIKYVYFKSRVNLKTITNSSSPFNGNNYDFISGYAKLETANPGVDYGVVSSGNQGSSYDIGFIRLKPSQIEGLGGVSVGELHPIQNASFQHIKKYRSELIYPNNSIYPEIADLTNFVSDINSMLNGYKIHLREQGFAKNISLSGYSQIRLMEPTGVKYGGGVRVKQITIHDGWEDMTNANYLSGSYGHVYDYTTEENGQKISSGVAYEPIIGGEQSPLAQPIEYEYSNLANTSHQSLFMETPHMQQYYPGASVGYGKVTVRSLKANLDISTGTTKQPTSPIAVYEFFTPKDFPVKVKYTEPAVKKPIPLGMGFGLNGSENDHSADIGITYSEARTGASQGYVIILNDMPGKLKSIGQYTANPLTSTPEALITKQEYIYHTNSQGELQNEVDVFTEDRKYQKALLGIEYDVLVEMHENRENLSSAQIDLNLDQAGIWPIVTIWGKWNKSINTSRTAVVQKIIHKSGILKATRIIDGQAVITTESLVYDALTGEALLTKVQNEFKDEIYSYKQKARWFYDGMDAAFKNVGLKLEGENGNPVLVKQVNGQYVKHSSSSLDLAKYFTVGDELSVRVSNTSTYVRAFVYGRDDSQGIIGLLDEAGNPLNIGRIGALVITRSGHKNFVHTNAGAIATLNQDFSPAPSTGTATLDLNNQKVLNASAVKFKDYHSTKVCETTYSCDYGLCVDYLPGVSTDANLITVEVDGAAVTDFSVGGSCDNGGALLPCIDASYADVQSGDVIVYIDGVAQAASSITESIANYNCSSVPNTICYGIPPTFFGYANPCEGYCVKMRLKFTNNTVYNYPVSGSSDFTSLMCNSCSNCECVHDATNPHFLHVKQHLGNATGKVVSAGTVYPLGGQGMCLPVSTAEWYDKYQYSYLFVDFRNLPSPHVLRTQLQSPALWQGGGQSVPNLVLAAVSPGSTHAISVETANGSVIYENASYTFGAAASGQQVTVPIPLGDHTVDVFRDGNFVESFSASSSCNDRNDASILASCNEGSTTNPFLTGEKGIWRTWTSFAHKGDREYPNAIGSPGLREKGILSSFTPFSWASTATNESWEHAGFVTKYSKEGHALESRDVLKNYSASLYTDKTDLPIAIAGNARYQDIMFESFENYDKDCDAHFQIMDPVLTTEESHTGQYSMYMDMAAGISGIFTITTINLGRFDEAACIAALQRDGFSVTEEIMNGYIYEAEDADAIPEYLKPNPSNQKLPETLPLECSCNGKFSPLPTKPYVLNTWVKENRAAAAAIDTAYHFIELRVVAFDASSNTLGFFQTKPKGNIIEGWQQHEVSFELPANTTHINIVAVNTSSSGAYIDDIRIHPAKAAMETYVYDPIHLKPSAVLDNRNHATYYIYDEEGQLIKVKKETEEGIKTIQESRAHVIKRD